MPRVHHVKKAGKDYPDVGVKKGEPYYWWEFRYGGLRRSKTYPKPWQLTNSPFLQGLYRAQDRQANLTADDGLENAVQELAQELRDLGQEAQDSLDNMPENLQQNSSTGEMLQGRIDAMEAAAEGLEDIDFSDRPEKEDEDQETFDARLEGWLEDKLSEAQAVDISDG